MYLVDTALNQRLRPLKPQRESLLFLLMGQTGLLMQIAHPRVARAVREHSSYSDEPVQRLWRTYRLSMNLFTGNEARAREAAATINRAHGPVKGQGYNARDPHLGRWVWATLVYGALRGHTQFFAPLTPEEKRAILDTFRQRARLLGLGEDLPCTTDELYDYMAQMIVSGEVRVEEDAREIARMILGPVPDVLRPLTAYLARATLPAALRRQYGLSWSPLSHRAFQTFVRPTAQLLLPRLTAEMNCLQMDAP